VKSGGFKGRAQFFEDLSRKRRIRIASALQLPINVVHPEADGFHVKRGDGAPKRFTFFEYSLGVFSGGETAQDRQKLVELGQCRASSFGHGPKDTAGV
jgi:hypothetical protein